MNIKKRLIGASVAMAMLGGVGAGAALAAPPPQIKPSAHRVVLDEFSCFDITIDARKFTQNSNEYDFFIADVNLGFGDVPPDGMFSTSATICGLLPGTYELRATTTDGQQATSKLRIAG